MFGLLHIDARQLKLFAAALVLLGAIVLASAAQAISAAISEVLGAGSGSNSLAVASCDLTDESQGEEIHFAGCAGFF